jgi:hypothetical protein
MQKFGVFIDVFVIGVDQQVAEQMQTQKRYKARTCNRYNNFFT